MKEKIIEVQDRFIEIKTMLATDDLNTKLLDDKFLEKLTDNVEETFVKMNEGICESAQMCYSCANQRDYLRDVVDLLEEIEDVNEIDENLNRDIVTFKSNIDETLGRIDDVLATID